MGEINFTAERTLSEDRVSIVQGWTGRGFYQREFNGLPTRGIRANHRQSKEEEIGIESGSIRDLTYLRSPL